MFDTETAFRHFHCHGVVHRRKRLGKIIYKCATCWEWSEDLLDLVKDPELDEPAFEQDNQKAVPNLPSD